MKKLFIYLGVLLAAVACNQKEKAATETATSITDYPYELKTPHKNWQAGNPENAVIVLKMIKAWETKNAKESASYFADSVEISLDMFHEKMANDSIQSFLESAYANYASNLKITMQDWESVISEDKKDEWVTVWYKQSWVNAKGVADSMNCVNDAKLVNGKIVEFDEYIQHFPPAKE